jgi:hypothetical protein
VFVGTAVGEKVGCVGAEVVGLGEGTSVGIDEGLGVGGTEYPRGCASTHLVMVKMGEAAEEAEAEEGKGGAAGVLAEHLAVALSSWLKTVPVQSLDLYF